MHLVILNGFYQFDTRFLVDVYDEHIIVVPMDISVHDRDPIGCQEWRVLDIIKMKWKE
jgi:hypothetical protein